MSLVSTQSSLLYTAIAFVFSLCTIDNSLWASAPDNYTSADYPEGEDCAILNGRLDDAKWGDVSCLRKEKRICEILCA